MRLGIFNALVEWERGVEGYKKKGKRTMIGGYTKTFFLMAFMTGLFLAIGYALAGYGGAMIALGFALLTNFFAYWNADKMILRYYKAQPIDENHASELYAITRMLADNAGLPMPKLYLVENPQPNAFATGRNPDNAVVAVTSGLLEHLDTDEVAGVIAHELAHVKNHDMLIMTIAASFSGAISMLAHWAIFMPRSNDRGGALSALALMILAPMAAALVQMSISRGREYEADRMGAEISGRPEWLADALEKISQAAQKIPNPQAENNEGTAHLFIIDPLRGFKGLFMTHPPVEERIKRLRAMR